MFVTLITKSLSCLFLIRIEMTDNNLSLEVWDQGVGFNIKEYAAPEPGDFQEGGYGWLILHRIMDRVEYQLQVGAIAIV